MIKSLRENFDEDYQKRLEKEGDLFSDIYAIDFDMSSVLSEMELLH